MDNSISEITNGIRVSVKTAYLARESSLKRKYYAFAYQIEIINESQETVQLISREWLITDAWGNQECVQGEGVVGLQPTIAPNKRHIYTSGTHFSTPIGKMNGFYYMRNVSTSEMLKIAIPTFVMQIPYMMC